MCTWVRVGGTWSGGVAGHAAVAHEEELHADDGEDELKEEDDAEDVGDIGRRVEEEGEDRRHPRDAAHEAQRAQHTKQADDANARILREEE